MLNLYPRASTSKFNSQKYVSFQRCRSHEFWEEVSQWKLWKQSNRVHKLFWWEVFHCVFKIILYEYSFLIVQCSGEEQKKHLLNKARIGGFVETSYFAKLNSWQTKQEEVYLLKRALWKLLEWLIIWLHSSLYPSSSSACGALEPKHCRNYFHFLVSQTTTAIKKSMLSENNPNYNQNIACFITFLLNGMKRHNL